MKPHRPAILSYLWLLLCLGTGALWAGGYWKPVGASWTRPDITKPYFRNDYHIHSFSGTLEFARESVALNVLYDATVNVEHSGSYVLPDESSSSGVLLPDDEESSPMPAQPVLVTSTPVRARRIWTRLGFEVYHERNSPMSSHHLDRSGIRVPAWLPLLACAGPPALRLALLRKRRRSRAARGLCTACGYDLCASPDRCPECGLSNPLRPLASKVLRKFSPAKDI
jgi:hypothetical protein